MNIKTKLLISAIAIITLGLYSSNGFAEDRTIKEFKEYVKQRLPNQLSEAQLDQLAKIVDEDKDGTISDSEFEKRMEAVQKVMADKEAIERNAKQDAGKGGKTKSGKKSDDKKKSPRGSRWEQMNQRMQAQLDKAGISPGKSLPDVAGWDIDGKPFKLASLKGNYSVIINGCLT